MAGLSTILLPQAFRSAPRARAPGADPGSARLIYFAPVLHSALAILSVILFTVLFGLPALVLSLANPSGDWVVRFGRRWAGSICAASGVRVEAHGVENLPASGSYLLIANHKSHFDLLAFLKTYPSSFRVVAKRALFRIPVFGWCLSAAGMIPIDRESRTRAVASLDEVVEKVRTGMPVLFFPEGTRSREESLLPFKKGAFAIALKTGLPIVPVSISGGLAILPKGSIAIRPGTIVIRYGAPIASVGPVAMTREELAARVRDAVEAGLALDRPAPGGA
jgi:1-acyl-sn-glycerol-3-phosphate acyltransferase